MKKMLLMLSVSLFAGAAHAQLVNGSMEAWRTYTSNGTTLEAPNGWYGLDSNIAALAPLVTPQKQVFKSTDKHGGTYAARLVSQSYTVPTMGSLVVPGVISNAAISISVVPTIDFSFSGGTRVTQRSASVTAWVKYTPGANTDSANIGIQAILQGVPGADGQDSVIGEGSLTFGAKSAYTQVTVPIVYYTNATPTHIQIGFASGGLDNGTSGSELFVDDVVLNGPSGITRVLMNADVVKCYPNPTNGTLYLSSKEQDALSWEALNATGQVIAQQTFKQNATVALGNLPAGNYYFRVFDKSRTLVQTGKFTMQ